MQIKLIFIWKALHLALLSQKVQGNSEWAITEFRWHDKLLLSKKNNLRFAIIFKIKLVTTEF